MGNFALKFGLCLINYNVKKSYNKSIFFTVVSIEILLDASMYELYMQGGKKTFFQLYISCFPDFVRLCFYCSRKTILLKALVLPWITKATDHLADEKATTTLKYQEHR